MLAILGFAAVLIRRELTARLSFKPVLGGIAASVAGGVVLWWLLRENGPILATLVSLLVYSGFMVFLRIISAKDMAMVLGWVRQAVVPGARA